MMIDIKYQLWGILSNSKKWVSARTSLADWTHNFPLYHSQWSVHTLAKVLTVEIVWKLPRNTEALNWAAGAVRKFQRRARWGSTLTLSSFQPASPACFQIVAIRLIATSSNTDSLLEQQTMILLSENIIFSLSLSKFWRIGCETGDYSLRMRWTLPQIVFHP